LKIKPMSFACLRFEIFTLFCFCWATNKNMSSLIEIV
jgi:hypothetical protein